MRRPRALRPGARVAVLTLASPSRPDDLEAGADELRRLGFEPVVRDAPRGGAGYVAGEAVARADQLREVMRDPAITAIVAARGGYGSAQVLPYLDVDEIRETATLMIGYSDITALLDTWVGLAGVMAIHGPMVEGRLAAGASAYDRDSFLRVIGEPTAFGAVETGSATVLQAGKAAGLLRGGTLTQIASLLGTPWAHTAAEPTLLFLDEVNERPYRLDRMIWQLRAAGVLARVTGIVLNELPGCDEPGGAVTAVDAVREALAGFTGPIVAGVRSGHTSGAMITLPFGVQASLEADAGVSLTIDEPAVA